MTAAEARSHIRYSGWASRKLVDAVEALTAEERIKPMGVSHESIQETLGHILCRRPHLVLTHSGAGR